MKIGIVDYGMGNIFSIKNAFKAIGVDAQLTNQAGGLKDFDGLVLPGVGAFPEAMASLHRLELTESLKEFKASGKSLLGICLGMQLLMQHSIEFESVQGLGLVDGQVEKFPGNYRGEELRIPHIGWNSIHFSKSDHPALESLKSGADMYFVHSFFVRLEKRENELTSTRYHNFDFTSSLIADNIWAFQFHPEKSGPMGLRIYENWVSHI